jgi:hypothetical protein
LSDAFYEGALRRKAIHRQPTPMAQNPHLSRAEKQNKKRHKIIYTNTAAVASTGGQGASATFITIKKTAA